jgi:hypothetical protein
VSTAISIQPAEPKPLGITDWRWPYLVGPSARVRVPAGYSALMQRLIIACILSLVLLSCGKPTEKNVIEVKNGAYKVEVRSQEFHHSGLRNVDICVADVVSKQFPMDEGQCFLHGFDFSGLTVKWLSGPNIEISFRCGRVSRFSNFALISKGHPLPVEFHATLNDGCTETRNSASQ